MDTPTHPPLDIPIPCTCPPVRHTHSRHTHPDIPTPDIPFSSCHNCRVGVGEALYMNSRYTSTLVSKGLFILSANGGVSINAWVDAWKDITDLHHAHQASVLMLALMLENRFQTHSKALKLVSNWCWFSVWTGLKTQKIHGRKNKLKRSNNICYFSVEKFYKMLSFKTNKNKLGFFLLFF